MLAIICLVLWIYLLTVFKRAKVGFFEYIWGSVGLFIFLMVIAEPVITPILTQLVASAAGVIGEITGLYEAYPEYNIVFINNPNLNSSISLFIDYECSGIIEMFAFVSLICFFKVYEVGQRIIISIIGCIAIFFANLIRIFIIAAMIYQWGNDVYYLAHSMVGRIVFYAFTILLYYYSFTHAQIIKQKIGGFQYGEHTENSIR